MNRHLVIIVGLALTAACILLYVFEPNFLRRVANITYDALLRQELPKSKKIVLVDIDEASLARFHQWPWPRFLLAELTRRLHGAGARVVAFDIVFPESDRTSPARLQELMREHFKIDVNLSDIPPAVADFDRMFAEALAGGRTVLGCYLHQTDRIVTNDCWPADPNYRGYFLTSTHSRNPISITTDLFQATNITVSIPLLNRSAGNSAFFNVVPDFDNIIRSSPLVWSLGPKRIYPSLALEAVRMYLEVPQLRIVFDEDGISSLMVRDRIIPTDAAGRLVINYRLPIRGQPDGQEAGGLISFPSLSAADVITGAFDPAAVHDKIVFVGTSVVGLRDIRATPFSRSCAGVEINATIADNILADDMLRNPAWAKHVDIGLIFLTGLFLTFMIHQGKSWISFLVIALLILAAIQTSLHLQQRSYFVFVPSRVIVSSLLIYVVLTVIKFWQEEWQKRWVRNLFGSMVSPEVLRYLERNPGGLSLRGVRTDATMMFADIVEFTPIAEALQPERLSRLLNEFLSPMTSIIMERKGYVDKYEGDLIMADWGVPFSMPDHAVQACLAAIDMQECLAEMRPRIKAEYGSNIHLRIGINSGTVTAGNMGSDRKFQYTVIGDAVNQAARLETANKEYRTEILIGATTFDLARDVIEARMLDRLVMKGRSQPVLIYDLFGRKGLVAPARLEVARLYESALELYWQQSWDDAGHILEQARKIDPKDGPVNVLLTRITLFRLRPPPDGWSGAFTSEWKP